MTHWASSAIELLEAGKVAIVRPRGNSMHPKIHSGARVTLEPVTASTELAKNDIVLVKVKGSVYLHLISAIDIHRVQISNNRGHVNGWAPKNAVWGRVAAINNTQK
jgi:phage repressor protein C with HTH and peptisase S24 domain